MDLQQRNKRRLMDKPPGMVWLPMDHRLLDDDGQQMPFVVLGDKYARAVRDSVHGQAVLFPLADATQIPDLLALVDGVMLTGSPSNVDPAYFSQPVADPSLPLDPQRDALTLALVRACLHDAVPLLGLCRGFQEINVALGGTLHQQVHVVPGMRDHREPSGAPVEVQYGAAHEVIFEPGSVFAEWAGADRAQVNSLHGQGVARLAQGLRAEGHAPDGLIEAFSVQGAHSFAVAVQWHPEWRSTTNPFYAQIFSAFGAACRERQKQRLGTVPATGQGRFP